MKVWRVIVVLLLVLGLFQILVSFKREDKTPDLLVREQLVEQLRNFSTFVYDSLEVFVKNNASETQLQQAFLRTREYYKSVEWAAEYFTYGTAKLMNGAPKPEMDMASQSITNPNGLQVMEEYLFPHYNVSKKEQLQKEVRLLLENIAVLKTYFTNIEIASWQILDAAKLEVFRLESLGITGFDNALTLRSMEETATALKSVEQVVMHYNVNDTQLSYDVSNAIAYLKAKPDFVKFDRAFFIRKYANPISYGIETIRRKYSKSTLSYNRLLRQEVFTLFDSGVFNSMAYAPFLEQTNVEAKIALGKQLFNDPAFSGTQTRSCASCHIESRSFANNVALEKAISGNGLIDRNTPTLLNTALQPQQFYDQRSETIETQIVDVIHNPKEMNGSIQQALLLIRNNHNYKPYQQKAYPDKTQLDEKDIVESLAAYVRSLVRLNSRFDTYMQGDDKAMNSEEVNGFNLFMGKAQCGTCHYMPLFSGVFPPKYIAQDVEVLGTPDKPDSKTVDADRGIYAVLAQQGLYDSLLMTNFSHAFKTVSVRNMTKTAPYMHNGVFKTLEEVMDFYNEGGGVGRGIAVSNQTLSLDKLNLTPTEIKAVIAFMKTLDSR